MQAAAAVKARAVRVTLAAQEALQGTRSPVGQRDRRVPDPADMPCKGFLGMVHWSRTTSLGP